MFRFRFPNQGNRLRRTSDHANSASRGLKIFCSSLSSTPPSVAGNPFVSDTCEARKRFLSPLMLVPVGGLHKGHQVSAHGDFSTVNI